MMRLPFLGLSDTPTDQDQLMRKSSRPVYPREVTIRLSGYQNHLCAYCKLPMSLLFQDSSAMLDSEGVPLDYATVEHYIPRSRGGEDAEPNLVAACRKCNKMRSNFPNAEMFEDMVAMLFQKPQVREQWHYVSM